MEYLIKSKMKGEVAQVKEEKPKKPAAKSSMEAREPQETVNPRLIELETTKYRYSRRSFTPAFLMKWT